MQISPLKHPLNSTQQQQSHKHSPTNPFPAFPAAANHLSGLHHVLVLGLRAGASWRDRAGGHVPRHVQSAPQQLQLLRVPLSHGGRCRVERRAVLEEEGTYFETGDLSCVSY